MNSSSSASHRLLSPNSSEPPADSSLMNSLASDIQENTRHNNDQQPASMSGHSAHHFEEGARQLDQQRAALKTEYKSNFTPFDQYVYNELTDSFVKQPHARNTVSNNLLIESQNHHPLSASNSNQDLSYQSEAAHAHHATSAVSPALEAGVFEPVNGSEAGHQHTNEPWYVEVVKRNEKANEYRFKSELGHNAALMGDAQLVRRSPLGNDPLIEAQILDKQHQLNSANRPALHEYKRDHLIAHMANNNNFKLPKETNSPGGVGQHPARRPLGASTANAGSARPLSRTTAASRARSQSTKRQVAASAPKQDPTTKSNQTTPTKSVPSRVSLTARASKPASTTTTTTARTTPLSNGASRPATARHTPTAPASSRLSAAARTTTAPSAGRTSTATSTTRTSTLRTSSTAPAKTATRASPSSTASAAPRSPVKRVAASTTATGRPPTSAAARPAASRYSSSTSTAKPSRQQQPAAASPTTSAVKSIKTRALVDASEKMANLTSKPDVGDDPKQAASESAGNASTVTPDAVQPPQTAHANLFPTPGENFDLNNGEANLIFQTTEAGNMLADELAQAEKVANETSAKQQIENLYKPEIVDPFAVEPAKRQDSRGSDAPEQVVEAKELVNGLADGLVSTEDRYESSEREASPDSAAHKMDQSFEQQEHSSDHEPYSIMPTTFGDHKTNELLDFNGPADVGGEAKLADEIVQRSERQGLTEERREEFATHRASHSDSSFSDDDRLAERESAEKVDEGGPVDAPKTTNADGTGDQFARSESFERVDLAREGEAAELVDATKTVEPTFAMSDLDGHRALEHDSGPAEDLAKEPQIEQDQVSSDSFSAASVDDPAENETVTKEPLGEERPAEILQAADGDLRREPTKERDDVIDDFEDNQRHSYAKQVTFDDKVDEVKYSTDDREPVSLDDDANQTSADKDSASKSDQTTSVDESSAGDTFQPGQPSNVAHDDTFDDDDDAQEPAASRERAGSDVADSSPPQTKDELDVSHEEVLESQLQARLEQLERRSSDGLSEQADHGAEIAEPLSSRAKPPEEGRSDHARADHEPASQLSDKEQAGSDSDDEMVVNKNELLMNVAELADIETMKKQEMSRKSQLARELSNSSNSLAAQQAGELLLSVDQLSDQFAQASATSGARDHETDAQQHQQVADHQNNDPNLERGDHAEPNRSRAELDFELAAEDARPGEELGLQDSPLKDKLEEVSEEAKPVASSANDLVNFGSLTPTNEQLDERGAGNQWNLGMLNEQAAATASEAFDTFEVHREASSRAEEERKSPSRESSSDQDDQDDMLKQAKLDDSAANIDSDSMQATKSSASVMEDEIEEDDQLRLSNHLTNSDDDVILEPRNRKDSLSEAFSPHRSVSPSRYNEGAGLGLLGQEDEAGAVGLADGSSAEIVAPTVAEKRVEVATSKSMMAELSQAAAFINAPKLTQEDDYDDNEDWNLNPAADPIDVAATMSPGSSVAEEMLRLSRQASLANAFAEHKISLDDHNNKGGSVAGSLEDGRAATNEAFREGFQELAAELAAGLHRDTKEEANLLGSDSSSHSSQQRLDRPLAPDDDRGRSTSASDAFDGPPAKPLNNNDIDNVGSRKQSIDINSDRNSGDGEQQAEQKQAQTSLTSTTQTGPTAEADAATLLGGRPEDVTL